MRRRPSNAWTPLMKLFDRSSSMAIAVEPRQVGMDLLEGRCSFPSGDGDALQPVEMDVAGDKDAGHRGLETERPPAKLRDVPGERILFRRWPARVEDRDLVSSQDEAAVAALDGKVLQPVR